MKIKVFMVFIILLFLSNLSGPFAQAKINPIAELDLLVCNDLEYKYGKKVKDDLTVLGIDITIIREESQIYRNMLLAGDFDLAFINFWGKAGNPDLSDIYTEDGSDNFFRLTREIPYGNLSHTMLEVAPDIIDPLERQEHYYDWQVLLMDKIVPILPFFTYTKEPAQEFYSYESMIFNLERPFIGGDNNSVWSTRVGREEYTLGVAVRKAICYAINRTAINLEINNGEYTIDHSPISSYLEYWSYDIVDPRYDCSINETGGALDWFTTAGYTSFLPLKTSYSSFAIIVIAFLALVSIPYLRRRSRK